MSRNHDPATLLAALRAALGEDCVRAPLADDAPELRDYRRRYQGRALAMLLPRDTSQVSTLLRFCHEQRIGVVPQGGNTSYNGGATPDASGTQVLVSLRRMNRIRAVDAANFSLTAEAGCTLQAVQDAAEAAQRFFPLSLGSQQSCQIGGNLATNAGGLNVLRFGMMRELALGIEAVLPDGSVLDGLTGLRKDNTGYDLKSLLIGSEGTLGIITAATLKLWPAQRSSATALLAIDSPAAAIRLLSVLREHVGERLTSFELMPHDAVELVRTQVPEVRMPFTPTPPCLVLCELTSAAIEPLDELLQAALLAPAAQADILDAVLAHSEAERMALWQLRESIPEAQRRHGPSFKHDVSVPLDAIPSFMQRVSEWVLKSAPEAVLICYGHAGDGNLHCNLSARSCAIRRGSGAIYCARKRGAVIRPRSGHAVPRQHQCRARHWSVQAIGIAAPRLTGEAGTHGTAQGGDRSAWHHESGKAVTRRPPRVTRYDAGSARAQ